MFVCGSGADILGSGNVRAADGQMDREDALGATMQESQPTRETGNLDLLGKSFGVRLKFISYPVGTILKSQNYQWGINLRLIHARLPMPIIMICSHNLHRPHCCLRHYYHEKAGLTKGKAVSRAILIW